MCEELWARNSYARAPIELNTDNVLKYQLVVVVPLLENKGTLVFSFEWNTNGPPRSGSCKIFCHRNVECSKNIVVPMPNVR